MMVDDAHASGVFGRQGRGTIDHFNCHGRVDIQVGTLSKAIGVLGGYVAGTQRLHRVPLSPRAAVSVFHVSPTGRCRGVHRRARRPRERAAMDGAALGQHPVLQGRPAALKGSTPGGAKARLLRSSSARRPRPWRCLTGSFNAGVFAQGIGFPTVARGQARLRTIVTATHTHDESAVRARHARQGGEGTGGHLNTSLVNCQLPVSSSKPLASESCSRFLL